MMLCVMARRSLARDSGSPTRALADHLASCAGCRSERERLARLVKLLTAASPTIRLEADQFTDRLMTTIEARKRASAGAPSREPGAYISDMPGGGPFAWAGFRPAAALPALCLMLAAGVMALYLSGQAIPGDATRLAASPVTAVSSADDYQDSLRPPREIPFSVEEDLVGMRRGTIPLTTYVLEPAPNKDAPVLLASF